MGQSRSKTGKIFEKSVCENKGWTSVDVKPRLFWSGNGRTNWDKIESINKDPSLFVPNLEKSRFEKYDAINQNGDKVEIKKYTSQDLLNWSLYSEPIFKIATRSVLSRVVTLFGDGDLGLSVVNYNTFLDGVIPNVSDDILNRITSSNVGIQCVDRFIPQSELEYRWNCKKSWKGFNRYTIEFRLNHDIP